MDLSILRYEFMQNAVLAGALGEGGKASQHEHAQNASPLRREGAEPGGLTPRRPPSAHEATAAPFPKGWIAEAAAPLMAEMAAFRD